mgnify:CR=1 FL=1
MVGSRVSRRTHYKKRSAKSEDEYKASVAAKGLTELLAVLKLYVEVYSEHHQVHTLGDILNVLGNMQRSATLEQIRQLKGER